MKVKFHTNAGDKRLQTPKQREIIFYLKLNEQDRDYSYDTRVEAYAMVDAIETRYELKEGLSALILSGGSKVFVALPLSELNAKLYGETGVVDLREYTSRDALDSFENVRRASTRIKSLQKPKVGGRRYG